MRKILSILLLVVLGLPSALPLLAVGVGDGESGLPACCRAHGKHHCTMGGDAGAVRVQAEDASVASDVREMRAAGEACPYRCAMLAQVHADPVMLAQAALRLYAGVVSHPAVQAQTESRWRVARERARGKRGPPERSESAKRQVGGSAI